MVFKPTAQGLLSPLFPWFEANGVSELMLNQPGQLFVESKGSIQCVQLPVLDERYLYQLFRLIANESSQIINRQQPMMSASLFNGSRIQCIIPPVTKYPVFAIRLPSRDTPSLSKYTIRPVSSSSLDLKQAATDNKQVINDAIEKGCNIVVCGATGSGKTTFVNACLQLIDNTQRLILIEDTPELRCNLPNTVNLYTMADQSSSQVIDFKTLVKLSLRLRPDRIIIGEIRGDEVVDFIGACNTGHKGSITSVHANNPKDALLRLRQLYLSAAHPGMDVALIDVEIRQAIDLIIHISKQQSSHSMQLYPV